MHFHIGADLDRLRQTEDRIEASSSLRGPPLVPCALGGSIDFSPQQDFVVCTYAFIKKDDWQNFIRALKAISGNDDDQNLAAAIGYVAAKLLIEAINTYKTGSAEQTATILRTKKFNTLIGSVSFNQGQQLLTTPVIVTDPRGTNSSDLASRIDIVATKKCDSCKRGECPQGAILSRTDCCKSSNECPQGIILH
jgi:hypothetical protein